MSHPFGNLITQHRSRKHGLSQNKLADGIGQNPAVITKMCQGKRLTGPQARERVIAIIHWFFEQHVLHYVEEANALLAAAEMAGLREDHPQETILLQALRERGSVVQQTQQSDQNHLLLGNLPPRPSLMIGREEALHDLKVRLMSIDRGQGSAAAQVLTAVHGWPGVGKTTLAAALAHDPDIQTVFPDGILWTSLGQTPDILTELVIWGRALRSGQVTHAQSIEEAATQLAARLQDKHMLLIVDDVWKVEHAVLFRVGGPACALLLTTRLPNVAQALAATSDDIYRLPILTDEKALELLKILAPTVIAQYPRQSRELVRELEGLPLALQVAGRLLNAEVRYGWGVAELLEELRTGSRLLESQAPAEMTDLVNETIPTVAVLLKKSTDRLDPQTRGCFALLGAFAPKPATFDFAALQAVWQVSDSKQVVRALVDRGLLETTDSARFQMHALLVLHARSLLTE